MADAGFDDLLGADERGRRAQARAARATARTRGDDRGGRRARVLPGLAQAARAPGSELRVLVECDTGLGRTGVVDAARRRRRSPARSTGFASLSFAGFLTYPSPARRRASSSQRAVEEAARHGLERRNRLRGRDAGDVVGRRAQAHRDGVPGRHLRLPRPSDRRGRRGDPRRRRADRVRDRHRPARPATARSWTRGRRRSRPTALAPKGSDWCSTRRSRRS